MEKQTIKVPVEDRGISDEGDGVVRDPFPEHDLLVHRVGLHLDLLFDVEDLHNFSSCICF